MFLHSDDIFFYSSPFVSRNEETINVKDVTYPRKDTCVRINVFIKSLAILYFDLLKVPFDIILHLLVYHHHHYQIIYTMYRGKLHRYSSRVRRRGDDGAGA
jgi:hypothetical protein